LIDELQTDDGDVIDNDHNGRNFFVTSFAALAPDATVSNGVYNVYTSGDSYYVVFVLNLTSGEFNVFEQERLGEIASYSNAVIDSDDELWVNYTLFPFSSPPVVNVEASTITTPSPGRPTTSTPTPTPSSLYVMTPLTVSGSAFDGFAAQLWSGSGGTFGKYSSTVSIPGCSDTVSVPLAWMVLLPSE
jgi:hypothetical protein